MYHAYCQISLHYLLRKGLIMKRLTKLLAATVVYSCAQSASATIIADNYIGADDHNWGDRIGNHTTSGGGYTFEIHNMEVDLVGTMLSVQINTNYAGHAGLWGTGYGDLFLSNSWNPAGSELNNYLIDDNTNGTTWTYGFSLDGNRYDANNMGGTGTLYKFTTANSSSDNANNAVLSDAVTSSTFRNGQEVIVRRDSGDAVSNGSWSISNDDADDYIVFNIDLANTGLLTGDEIALHWGMTCGNDTIEGAYAVPEPGILALLGLGAGILGFTSRRRNS